MCKQIVNINKLIFYERFVLEIVMLKVKIDNRITCFRMFMLANIVTECVPFNANGVLFKNNMI